MSFRAHPAQYYAWLQEVMRTPDPAEGIGNNATAAEQTIEAATPQTRGLCRSRYLSEENEISVQTNPAPSACGGARGRAFRGVGV